MMTAFCHPMCALAELAPGASPSVMLWLVLVAFLVMLLVILLVGSAMIMRWGRRFLAEDARVRPRPTATSDVWSVHSVPDVGFGGASGGKGGSHADENLDEGGRDPGDSSDGHGDPGGSSGGPSFDGGFDGGGGGDGGGGDAGGGGD